MGMGDIGVHYDMPSIMYVKYVFDSNGYLTSYDTSFTLGVSVTAEGETVTVTASFDMSLPRVVYDSDFDTTIPDEVVSTAVDISGVLSSLADGGE